MVSVSVGTGVGSPVWSPKELDPSLCPCMSITPAWPSWAPGPSTKVQARWAETREWGQRDQNSSRDFLRILIV